jgi:hypothetical protein
MGVGAGCYSFDLRWPGAHVLEPHFAAPWRQSDDVRPPLAHAWTMTHVPMVGKLNARTPYVAIFGGSHARQWGHALAPIARKHGWALRLFYMGACDIYDGDSLALPLPKACIKFLERSTAALLQSPPDVVFVTATRLYMQPRGVERAFDETADLYVRTRGALIAAGIPLVAVRGNPQSFSNQGTADCLLNHGGAYATARACVITGKNFRAAEAAKAAKQAPIFIDMTPFLCPGDAPLQTRACPGVIGNVVVYSDRSHMSPEYLRSLAGPLEAALVAAEVPLPWAHGEERAR